MFWNVERLRHPEAISAIVQREQPDVLLACEIDRGMARTGNADRIDELSAKLGMSYLYGVEFIELDLGDVDEKRAHAGHVNQEELHGAAIMSSAVLQRPFLIRIDRRGDWFDGSRHEPRVGGTIAIGAQVIVNGLPCTMVNVHLESHGDRAERQADMLRVLTLVDTYDAKAPVVMGGDFNTSTASRHERFHDRGAWLPRLDADPARLLHPQVHEPLFALAAQVGYDWTECNMPGIATTRFPATSEKRNGKIDWYFTRGCKAADPKVVNALRPCGHPASDHEAICVRIFLGN